MTTKRQFYIVGTDTDVGKTVVSLLLMQYLYAQGYQPFYCKPYQTGCQNARSEASDARFIYQHIPQLQNQDPNSSTLTCFSTPKAPFFAARDDGQSIDLSAIQKKIQKLSTTHQTIVLEAAGGIMVPLTEHRLLIDTLHLQPLIVARAGLGTINHTLLTIEALVARGLDPMGIIFTNPHNETSPEMIRENQEAIESFSPYKVFGVIGPISDFSQPSPENYHPFEKFMKHIANENIPLL